MLTALLKKMYKMFPALKPAPSKALALLNDNPGISITLVTRNFHNVAAGSTFRYMLEGSPTTHIIAIEELAPDLVPKMLASAKKHGHSKGTVSWEEIVEFAPEIAKVLDRKIKVMHLFGSGGSNPADKQKKFYGPFSP